MEERIRVRFVPKSTTGESFGSRGGFGGLGGVDRDRLRTDRDRAVSVRAEAFEMGLDPRMTPQNTVEALVPVDRFEGLFGTPLTERTKEPSALALGKGRYLAPLGELKVPAKMSNEISFAYVPTPPRFFGLNHVPPSAAVYHLRVEDVARILRANRCHRHGWTGRGVRIAMADSGFAKHPFFDHHHFNIQRVSTPLAPDPHLDVSGHGTGESANTLVIAPDCQFFGVKHDDYSALALETAIEQAPKILVNSWGWDIDTVTLDELRVQDTNQWNELRDVERILLDAVAEGILVVFAAGNGHRAFPACMPSVIAAGGVAVAADGGLSASSYASSFVSKLYPNRQVPDSCGIVGEASENKPLRGHIMLPVPNGAELEGENLPSLHQDKGWGIFSGTSAAAPQLAGILGLMATIKPDLKQEEARRILAATARDVTRGRSAMGDLARPGSDAATGAGLVDAFAACLMTEQITQGNS